MIVFASFQGRITAIENFVTGRDQDAGCFRRMTLENQEGSVVNFIARPDTYFLDNQMMMVGDWVTGFYNSYAPVPLIYPPQYHAIVMAPMHPRQFVSVDFFNKQLINTDATLQLTISPLTEIVLENGQYFIGNPSNRYLVVVYDVTTRSIPARTNPKKIVVLCLS